MPDCLVQNYQWAYLWHTAVWFFDHQPIINLILFGNYREIMEETMRMIDAPNAGETLQIASVYGELIPRLARDIEDLHLIDIAPVQLEAAARKLKRTGTKAELHRMNAENLGYSTGSFDTAVIFLLLHEMPPESRANSLREAIRVLRKGGRLVIAEYGEKKRGHFIHRFAPLRWILTKSEPFLGDFWSSSLIGRIEEAAMAVGKEASLQDQADVFGGFYRVMSFRIA